MSSTILTLDPVIRCPVPILSIFPTSGTLSPCQVPYPTSGTQSPHQASYPHLRYPSLHIRPSIPTSGPLSPLFPHQVPCPYIKYSVPTSGTLSHIRHLIPTLCPHIRYTWSPHQVSVSTSSGILFVPTSCIPLFSCALERTV